MTLTLYILSGKELGRVERFEQTQILIGRVEGADLRLKSPGISREHARLIRKGPEVVQLVDLDSTSGTFLLGDSAGEVQAERIRQVVLSDGALFRLADVELRLRIEAGPGGSKAAGSQGQAANEDSGLELEGEWGEATIAPSQRHSAVSEPGQPASKTAAGPGRPPKKAASELQKLKQQSGKSQTSPGGKKVLQYNRVDGEAGAAGGDFLERPGWQRVLILLAAALLLGALAYGSFQLTQGLRDARATPSEPLD